MNEQFAKPDVTRTSAIKHGSYDKLDLDGMISPECLLVETI